LKRQQFRKRTGTFRIAAMVGAGVKGMGSRSRSGRTWLGRVCAALSLFATAVALAGCGATIGDYAPTAIGGLPEGTPQRPKQSSAYPAVHDMPPPRATQVLTDAERNKLEGDLAAARERAAAAAKPAGDADKP
jgi:hypothetical protein